MAKPSGIRGKLNPPKITDLSLDGQRLLFVDDNPKMLRVFERSMRFTGLDIDLAQGPSEALELASKTEYPLIVTDLQMPGMSGLELIDRLWKTNPKASFVLMTGIGELNLPTDSPSARAITCMVRKPWLPPQVHQALLHAMQLYWVRTGVKLLEDDLRCSVNVLLVADDDHTSRQIADLLGKAKDTDYPVRHVRRLMDGIRHLQNETYDIVLTDLALADARGLDAVAGLHRACPLVPVVVLSDGSDEDLAAQAVRSGAQDYIVKGSMTQSSLERTVRYAIEQKSNQEHLEYLSNHDQLTGLPNRTLFAQRVSDAIGQLWGKSTCLAVLVLDLDRFKHVNDTLGHSLGDALIVEVADRLSDVNTSAVLARLGGDEFAVLLEGCSEAEISAYAQDILATMKEPFLVEGQVISSSASIGIALFPANGKTADQLIGNADAAMYRSKESGGNTYIYFDEEMHLKAVQWMELERELAGALQRGEFELHYQPQVDCATSQVVCFEALLRWTHPVLGSVSPYRFIPVLEGMGLIGEVGEWALRTGCRQLATWRKRNPSLRMAVNVSALQFDDASLDDLVRSALEEACLPADALELEITEGLVMRDSDRTLEILGRLKKLGVRIAVDDFGTGYSNLSYLARFPIDLLKIDRSIVQMIGGYEGDCINRAVIELSHALNIEILAEGVELQEQLVFLDSNNVQSYQGYYFAKPMPAGQCERFVVPDESDEASPKNVAMVT